MSQIDYRARARHALNQADNPDEFITVDGRLLLYGTAIRCCVMAEEQWRTLGLTPHAEIDQIRKRARKRLETLQ